jgi:hypothetical protein
LKDYEKDIRNFEKGLRNSKVLAASQTNEDLPHFKLNPDPSISDIIMINPSYNYYHNNEYQSGEAHII